MRKFRGDERCDEGIRTPSVLGPLMTSRARSRELRHGRCLGHVTLSIPPPVLGSCPDGSVGG